MTQDEYYKTIAGLVNWKNWPTMYNGYRLVSYRDKSGNMRYFAYAYNNEGVGIYGESFPKNSGYLYLDRLLKKIDELNELL